MRSIVLVIGQFGSIAAILAGGAWILPPWAWIVFGAGWLLFAWAVWSIGANNFTIMPDPRKGNTLTQRGPYRWLRHPMYTAVIVCGGALAIGAPSTLRWIAWSICIAVLVIKVRYEEAAITAAHPHYPQRMKGVWRLVPFVW